MIEHAVSIKPADPGLWYALGWLAEFVAHESQRRSSAPAPDVRALYLRAEAAFQRCLGLQPEGKLKDDAEDLLDHVQNQLAST